MKKQHAIMFALLEDLENKGLSDVEISRQMGLTSATEIRRLRSQRPKKSTEKGE